MSIPTNSSEFPLINIKTSQTDGTTSLGLSRRKSDPVTQVAIRTIQNISSNEHSSKANLLEDVVHINVKEDKGEVVRIGVGIYDLARAMHFEPEEIEKAIDEGHLEQMIEKSLKEKLDIKEDIKSHLPEYGLTPEEFRAMDDFYTQSQDLLSMVYSNPTVIRKGMEHEYFGTTPDRTMAFLPDKTLPLNGMFAFLKDRGGVEEVGVGSVGRATLCLCLDTGKTAILKSAHKDHVPKEEVEMGLLALKHSKFLAGGVPFDYEGSFRARGREKNEPKDHITQHKDQPKVGIMMFNYEGGSLFDQINAVSETSDAASERLSEKDKFRICCEYALCIAKLHELGFIHLDQKSENVLMTKEMHARLSDFGAAVKEGSPIIGLRGSAGFIAPELYQALLDRRPYDADYSADIWSLGSLLAEVTRGNDWYDWSTHHLNQTRRGIVKDLSKLEEDKDVLFPERGNELHPDHIIDMCLREDPSQRPKSAKEIADALIHAYEQKYGSGSFAESQKSNLETSS